jgi:hypothetical protein
VKTIKANNFEVTVAEGGYPVWIEIFYGERESYAERDRNRLYGIRHTELPDLKFAIDRAIVAARAELPDRYKAEMD